jgi:uncharacterized protein YndB with AHSA1/START domain
MSKILFPASFAPANSPVFVHNEIDINAKPEAVWNWLIKAGTWPEWYFNAANVALPSTHLSKDTVFRWKTFGNTLQSQVQEFVPNERLAWLATGSGIKAYHARLIIPTGTGCKVITEETQHGWMCRLGKILFPKRMYKYHQIWLEGLKLKAEKVE